MVVGICCAKDEIDILEFTVLHMREECDAVIVADNGSTDGTREMLQRLSREPGVVVREDPEVGYYQSARMSRMAAQAAAMGATWVVPFDADEWWYSPHSRIADVLADQSAAAIATAELYDHVPTAQDPGVADPVTRIGWRRREPAPLAKVAVRPSLPVTIEQGNHGATFPTPRTIDGLLVVRHFPYRSADQFVSKVRNGAAAYAATDLPEDVGKHWRDYGRLLDSGGPDAIGDVFRAWFWSAAPEEDPSLIFDPAPHSA